MRLQPMFTNLSARVRLVFQREGFRGVLAHTAAKVVAVRAQVLLQRDLTKLSPHKSGLHCEWASMEDLIRYDSLALTADPETRAKSEARLQRGDRCVIGFVDGSPVTYLWVTTKVRELPRCDWPVGDRHVFLYKTFTVPKWRGRGFNVAAVAWMLDEFRMRGFRSAFVDVDHANHYSLRALRSTGFRDVGRFWTIKLGSVTSTYLPRGVYKRVAQTDVLQAPRSDHVSSEKALDSPSPSRDAPLTSPGDRTRPSESEDELPT